MKPIPCHCPRCGHPLNTGQILSQLVQSRYKHFSEEAKAAMGERLAKARAKRSELRQARAREAWTISK